MSQDALEAAAPTGGAADPGRETPDVETSSDRYARRFAGPAGAYMLAVQEQTVAALLPAGAGSMLEVGGGHAQLAGPMAARGWTVTVLGSTEACRARLAADPGARSVAFRSGDLLALPYPDRGFDVVVSVRLISHMQDWRGLVAELARAADRSVIIDYPSLASLNCLTPLAFAAKRAAEANTTRRYRSFWPSAIRAAFAAHGFSPAGRRGQFVAPMAVHRLAGGAGWLQGAEDGLRRLGVTDLVGNPVIARFDRDPPSGGRP